MDEKKEKDYKVIPNRIEITMIKNPKGAVSMSMKTDEVGASLDEIIGMIEQVKFDLLQGDRERRMKPQLVQTILTEEHFEMDTAGTLKAKGLKVGDTVNMPKSVADMSIVK